MEWFSIKTILKIDTVAVRLGLHHGEGLRAGVVVQDGSTTPSNHREGPTRGKGTTPGNTKTNTGDREDSDMLWPLSLQVTDETLVLDCPSIVTWDTAASALYPSNHGGSKQLICQQFVACDSLQYFVWCAEPTLVGSCNRDISNSSCDAGGSKPIYIDLGLS